MQYSVLTTRPFCVFFLCKYVERVAETVLLKCKHLDDSNIIVVSCYLQKALREYFKIIIHIPKFTSCNPYVLFHVNCGDTTVYNPSAYCMNYTNTKNIELRSSK